MRSVKSATPLQVALTANKHQDLFSLGHDKDAWLLLFRRTDGASPILDAILTVVLYVFVKN